MNSTVLYEWQKRIYVRCTYVVSTTFIVFPELQIYHSYYEYDSP